MLRSTLAATALLALAACGGGFGTDYRTSEELVTALGCTDAEVDESEEFFVQEAMTCEFSGESVGVKAFANGKQLESWRSIADEFGTVYVEFGHAVVQTDTVAGAEAVEKSVGGTVRGKD